jgi:hypothetical protein
MKYYPSPFATCIIVFGIVLMGIAPPLGILVLLLAFAEQRRVNGRQRGIHQDARDKAAAKRQREYDAGIRYFA